MTISNTNRTAGPFTGNGVTTQFPFSFKVFSRSDLLVARTATSTAVESTLLLDADYTVTLNGNQNSNPGGVITLASALPVGTTLAATSNLPIQQSLDLTNNGGFYPAAINDALDRIVITVQQLASKVGAGSLNVGAGAAIASVLAFIGNVASVSGASLVGFISSITGAPRTVQEKLRERVSLDDYYFATDGNTYSPAFSRARAKVVTNGTIELIAGKSYRITDTVSLVSQHLFCTGKAEIIADMNDLTKDALYLDATVVRIGTAQKYVPACCLTGVTVLFVSAGRDGIRLAYGDFAVWDRVDVQCDPVTNPVFRDGVHVEPGADGKFIENLDFRAVRIHDACRDGFRFEVPATGTNVFINVGTYYNCEVRGAGQRQPGAAVNFVSNNLSANEKISSHTFTGGEYQLNATGLNPNPDAFKATVVAGGAPVENIHVNGATAECVPTNGTGFAFNTSGMTRTVLTNFLPFGFQGSGTGVGGTGKYPVVIGYLGIEDGQFSGSWTPTIYGDTTAGTPVVEFAGGVYTRIGRICFLSFQIKVTSFGGAAGQVIIGGLPVTLAIEAFAQPNGGIGRINQVTLGAGYTVPTMKGRANSKTIELNKLSSGGGNTIAINIADLTTTFELAGSIIVETA